MDRPDEQKGAFKVRLEVGLLRGYVFGLSTLVDECWVDISTRGLHTKAVDPAHVAMMEVNMDRGLFHDFKCIDEGRVGLNLELIAEELVRMSNREVITLETFKKDEKEPYLRLQFGNYIREIACPDLTGISDPKVPTLTLPNSFETVFLTLQNIEQRFNNVSDHIRINWYPEGVEFVSEGDTSKASFKLPKDLLESHEGQDKESSSLFPLDYFRYPFMSSGRQGCRHWFLKEEWLGPIKFITGHDYPIKMESERNGLYWMYLLAPRIESE